MKEQSLFDPVPMERYQLLSKEELIDLARLQERLLGRISQDNKRLRALNQELSQKSLFVEDQLITIKNKLFGKSSERTERPQSSRKRSQSDKQRVLLPTERYPEAPVIERHITLDNPPDCKCCGSQMQDSGMTEDSEYLTKVPAQYYVVVQLRHKYACRSCHGDIQTAPTPPRVKEGSSFSDELMIDVAVSKYCDLIPIERQAKMAAREGLKALPPQSLIETTHYLADFVREAYGKLKGEMLESRVWHADETPHRMLEGDKRSNWFLWGFSTKQTSYFEYHDTRSGDVVSPLLRASCCQHLMSDVFSGYGKSVRETNQQRHTQGLPLIENIYCNAHARRYFRQAEEKNPEDAGFYIKQYRKIYRLEGLAQKFPEHGLRIRSRQLKYFEKIRDKCVQEVSAHSTKSSLGKAINYFLKNYAGFTKFIQNFELPIDNNPAERLLRNPVIGRKTWYGTHSHRGAETAAVLFSLVESCKLNQISPREYFKKLVEDLHQGKVAFTPKDYKDLLKN